MALVLGKDNGLSQPVTTGHLDASGHEILQHHIHRILVKDELVQLVRAYLLWECTILSEIFLIPLLVRLRQLIVFDALLHELGLYFIVVVRHQHMILLHCLFVVIDISRYILFHFKEIIGIPVYLCLWSSCKPHQYGIKIIKDSLILFKNTAMAFIDDD